MRAVTAAQMRAIDAAGVARDGEVALMRAAGEAIANLIDSYARGGGPVVAIAGNGNNGGDAYAALASYGGTRRRIVYGDPAASASAARRDARERALIAGVEERAFPPDPDVLRGAALVLDGILGVNARLPLDARSAQLVAAIAACGAPVLALDVPTGIDPTTGAAGDPVVRANATIALGRPKQGCFFDAGRDATGELWCAPIGMHDDDADGIDDPPTHVLTPAEFAALLPSRPDDSDKRSAGAPLIVAGSTQFPGAAVLCAWGAARAGAGYVTVAAPDGAAAALRAHLVEQVVVTYDEREPERAVQTILDLTNRCNSIAIGPGLGLSDPFGTIVNGVIGGSDLPVVADASALYHLAKRLPDYRGKQLVITPHEGEFARISGEGHDRTGTAARAAARVRRRARHRDAAQGPRDADRGPRRDAREPDRDERARDGGYGRRADRCDRDAARAGARADRCGARRRVLARPRRPHRAHPAIPRRHRARRRGSARTGSTRALRRAADPHLLEPEVTGTATRCSRLADRCCCADTTASA